ncbi:hypothetical protein COCON_G00230810 [Conger conger]|uniref:Poly [ADP-ribose] polymerase n=1 Tax=Conger conger TaxID=82655 RepID=A0A9Q1CV22_CONCO|nr:hypothetical protein COCON_G00230810 [Conger conger]
MEAVEEAYCNPANNASKGISKVDFLTMTSGGSRVQRLSTVSSVTKPPHFILTTNWLWHWQGERGKWFEFGSEGDGDAPSITSQTLENVYLADTDREIPFTTGGQHYVLHFKDMIQENVKFKTRRPVRRRPRFLSGAEVEKKLKNGTPEASGSTPTSGVPEHWDQEALSDFEYKLTCLAAGSTEFSQVRKLFQRTMPSSTVHSIQRIQNPSLHRVFQWQKEKMQKKNGGKPVDQRLLFHGTEGALTQAICEQNFDWRMCGVHGSLYGKGSYFARDASYSDRFSKSSKGMKTMFAVQVLVGEFTRGNPTYLRPPAKGPKQSLYDSCVDSVEKPAVFVVFEKHQIYPEYIIEYSP